MGGEDHQDAVVGELPDGLEEDLDLGLLRAVLESDPGGGPSPFTPSRFRNAKPKVEGCIVGDHGLFDTRSWGAQRPGD